MSRDLSRAFAFVFEKNIAREETSDGVCDGLAGAAVQIDSGIVVAGEQQGIVGRPQCRSENVGRTWLATAIATAPILFAAAVAVSAVC